MSTQHQSWDRTTYRIRNIPGNLVKSQFESYLLSSLDLQISEIKTESYASDASWERDGPTITATASFRTRPTVLPGATNNWTLELPPDTPSSSSRRIFIDTHFHGFTPLSSANGHSIDCIVIHGWGGHAFGSFKAADSSFMWLRDALAVQFPELRMWIYGYDSKLGDQDSIGTFFEYADSFKRQLRTLRQKTGADKRGVPVIYIAHSLGGLIFQDAMTQMSKSSDVRDQSNLKSTYGALFFGVPGKGMDVGSLAAMVEDLPARFTLNLLDNSTGHQLRHRQHDEFCQAFPFRDSKVVQFYETRKSPTIQQVADSDKWARTGPKALLVDPDSASCGRSWETCSDYRIPLDSDHSNMVKFGENSANEYDKVRATLHDFVQDACDVVRRRLEAESNEDQTPRELRRKRKSSVYQMSKDEEKCLQLFRRRRDQTEESYECYKDRVEDRVEGTCQWFLNHENFIEWLMGPSGVLLVSADPGCGKSVLSKYLIDHELPRSATICYFFFKEQEQDSLKQALCAFLHQLFSKNSSLIRHAMPEYSKDGVDLADNKVQLWGILEKVAHDPSIGPTIFVLDALDECGESDLLYFIDMLKHLFSGVERHDLKVKFLLTSRPYEEITSQFRDMVESFPRIRIPGEEESERISEEVNCVIKYRVQKLSREKDLSPEITQHLEQHLLGIPHRTYLWAHLVFDFLRSQTFKKTKKGVESSLTTLPISVNQAYERILNKASNQIMMRKTLCIILAATRPLTLTEMNVAVNIGASSKSMADLDLEDEEDFRNTLRSWCGLFVSIYDNRVYLLHQTARDFLLGPLTQPTPNPKQSLLWHASISMEEAHSVLSSICVKYLDFKEFQNTELPDLTQFDVFLDRYPFLYYSATSWALHFRQAQYDEKADEIPLVLRACYPSEKHFLAWYKDRSTIPGDPRSSSFRLILPSALGLDRIVALVLPMEDANYGDRIGQTPLHWAATNGHLSVVRRLLAAGANINSQNRWGWTPLHRAANYGHDSVVQQLLDSGANIEEKNMWGWTALHVAASSDHAKVVEQLLDAGARIDAQTNYGQTALKRAIADGALGAMQQLIKRIQGVDLTRSELQNFLTLSGEELEKYGARFERIKEDIEAKLSSADEVDQKDLQSAEDSGFTFARNWRTPRLGNLRTIDFVANGLIAEHWSDAGEKRHWY